MDNIKDDASKWFESMGQEIQDYEVPPIPELDNASSGEPGNTASDAGLNIPELDNASSGEPGNTASDAGLKADPDHPYGDYPDVTQDDVRNVINLQTINRPTATVIVGIMDTLLPILITAVIVKGSEIDDAKLTDDERETLIQAWAVYLGDKQVQASPSMVLITTIVTIYGAKIFSAIQNRKADEQKHLIEKQQSEIENLRAEKERLEAKVNTKN